MTLLLFIITALVFVRDDGPYMNMFFFIRISQYVVPENAIINMKCWLYFI